MSAPEPDIHASPGRGDSAADGTAGQWLTCAVTGERVLSEDTVEFRGMIVSAEGKNILLQKLLQGNPAELRGLVAARPGSRLFAWVLDNLILFFGGGFPVVMFIGIILASTDADTEGFFSDVVVIGSLGGLRFIYFVIFDAIYGGSPGKLALGLRIVDKKGDSLSLSKALRRSLFAIGLPWFLFLLNPGFLFLGMIYYGASGLKMLSDSDTGRSLHDLFAGTRVIVKPDTARRTASPAR